MTERNRDDMDQELKELLAQLLVSQAETERQLRETDRQLKEVGRQLGKLGDKFGSFTEGMALPSMRKLLAEQFGLDNIAPRYRVQKQGRTLELDVFGFSNTDRNVAVVVEVKSHLREEGIEQLLRILREVPEFMPQHRDKKLYGILAAVDMPDDLRDRVLKEGLYLARISGDTFELQVPAGCVPRSFQRPPLEP